MPHGSSVTSRPVVVRSGRSESTCRTGASRAVLGARTLAARGRPRPPAGTSRSTSALRVDEPSAGERRAGRAGRASPTGRDPWADRHDHLLDLDRARARVSTAVTAPEPSNGEAGDLDPLGDLGAGRARLRRQAEHRLAVEREAAAAARAGRRSALGARQSPNSARMWSATSRLAQVELRRVADRLLALEDLDQVRLLRRRPERHVAAAVVMERLGSDSQISTHAAISSCIAGWK